MGTSVRKQILGILYICLLCLLPYIFYSPLFLLPLFLPPSSLWLYCANFLWCSYKPRSCLSHQLLVLLATKPIHSALCSAHPWPGQRGWFTSQTGQTDQAILLWPLSVWEKQSPQRLWVLRQVNRWRTNWRASLSLGQKLTTTWLTVHQFWYSKSILATDRELRCPPMTSILPWTMAGLLLCPFLTSPFSFARLCNSSGQVNRSFGAEGEVYGFSKNLWEFRLKHVKNSKWTQAYWHVPLTGTWLQV